MKFGTILLLTVLVVLSRSELNFNLARNLTSCPLELPIQVKSQTIFLDLSHNSDTILKTCLLKSINSEQTVTLLNVHETRKDFKVNGTTVHLRTYDDPNLIVMTKNLSLALIDTPTLKFLVKSYKSIFYIIVTSNKEYRCDDGQMNKKEFTFLKNFMKKLWYKLRVMRAAVAFPNACEQKILLYNDKRPSKTMKFYNRPIQLNNFINSNDLYSAIKKSGNDLAEQYPMRASIFHRYPTSINDCPNKHYIRRFNLNLTYGFCGLDGLVMHDILAHFKFNLSFPQDENCYFFGYAIPKNVSGSLGCIVRQELDISFNSRFMTKYSTESIYYLHYITADSLCALVRQSDVVPIWLGTFSLYQGSLWFIIFAVIVTIGVITWVIEIIRSTITGEQPELFWCYLYEALQTTLFGYSMQKTRTVMRGTCLLVSIVFVAFYQSHTSRLYTTLQRYKNIETLYELYKSGATLYTSPAIKELIRELHNPNDPLQVKFFKRIQLKDGEVVGNTLKYILENPGTTTLDRKTDVTLEIVDKFRDSHGKPLLHIVDQCYHTYYVSYIASVGFPFFEDLRIFIQRLHEAGLPTMYYKWTQRMLGLPDIVTGYRQEPRPFDEVKLGHHRISFGILFLGYFLSVILFIVEIWKGKH